MARWLRVLVLLAAALAGVPAAAQSLESVLSPGKLSTPHLKAESECRNCHVPFERNAQDRLCVECHKEIGQDMRARTGFHGRQKPQPCKECHTEHKGRDAHIVVLEPRQFDHAQTDFQLRGKHRQAECAKCHVAGKKYAAAPADCQSCHRKDDPHKGALGAKCESCHTESSWKEAKFDHATTRFALAGKHADARCDACHKTTNYKETPRTCFACHRGDDQGAKGHQGRFGEKCDSCHVDKGWKPAEFSHDADTKFVLRGRHRQTRCNDCHTGPVTKVKVTGDCWSCHQKDDKHKETLGHNCASCHTETAWKEKAKFDHERTDFPLLGKHAEAKCEACHKSSVFKEAPKDCVACHRKDDKHDGTLGERCASCHTEKSWKTTTGRFDHDKTKFALRNAHAGPKVACADCHADAKHYRDTPLDCVSCHQKVDKHEGQLGRDCAQCHVDRTWKTIQRFDHGLTRFPLLAAHAKVECKACHLSARFKDAKLACAACHTKDDRHKGRLGSACETCHNARSWKAWDFDHDRQTKYVLEAKHRDVACEACHTRVPSDGKVSASTQCVACHAKNDAHDGSYGRQCQQCHQPAGWRAIRAGAGRKVGAAAPPATRGSPG